MSTQPHDFTSGSRARNRVSRTDQATLESLLSRVQERDAAAFEELYERTVARVHALARCILHNRADTEDVVCDVFERAWVTASSYNAERGDALAWINAICRNRAIDVLRQRYRLKGSNANGRDNGDGDGGETSLTPHQFEPGSVVGRALTELSPLRRQILTLSFCRGLSHQEIANELSMPLGTVKSHLRRAISHLRTMLQSPGPGDPWRSAYAIRSRC